MFHSDFHFEGFREPTAINDCSRYHIIRLTDDIVDISWHSKASQKLPEGIPVNAVERLFIVDVVNMEGRITLQELFQNDAQGCNLIRAQSLISKACKSWRCKSTASFILFRRMRLNTFPGMDNSVIPRKLEQKLKSPFLRSLMRYPLCWDFFFFPCLPEEPV
ncbi:hypothetical protein DPMN_133012 [Dreissena polymorpha]|uniref:Uncharacterized protein n=1 Tax=Dreissena polymorpha TaxID=45954 RepID=A0A9D4JCJ9_DREPO|nr:hypothetical protein DPMN_133012 [Dreissena polymorpha]